MDSDAQRVAPVIIALRGFRDRIDEIIVALDTEERPDDDQITVMRANFRSLKEDLNIAAKFGTVSGKRRERSRFEDSYFYPAVTGASAYFTLPVNSHPLTTDWIANFLISELILRTCFRSLSANSQKSKYHPIRDIVRQDGVKAFSNLN